VCQDCHDAIHAGRPTRQFIRTGHRRATWAGNSHAWFGGGPTEKWSKEQLAGGL